MKTGSLLFFIFLSLAKPVPAREIKYLTDKQGEYIMNNQLNKFPDFDYATNTANLKVITDWVRNNNPVFNPPGGFDAIVRMGGNLSDDNRHSFYYGIMSNIHFVFYFFYMQSAGTAHCLAPQYSSSHLNTSLPRRKSFSSLSGGMADLPTMSACT